MSFTPFLRTPDLNKDGTLSTPTDTTGAGCYVDNYGLYHRCACVPINRLKQPISVSPTYCGCCAGHIKHHWQNALGIKMCLKSIDKYSLENDKGYSFKFTFEIIN